MTIIVLLIERVLEADGSYRLPKTDDDPDAVEELEVEVEGSYHYRHGRTYGAPSECYPDESDQEIDTVTLDGKEFRGTLTKSEEEAALEKIVESAQEDSEEDYDEPDDYDD